MASEYSRAGFSFWGSWEYLTAQLQKKSWQLFEEKKSESLNDGGKRSDFNLTRWQFWIPPWRVEDEVNVLTPRKRHDLKWYSVAEDTLAAVQFHLTMPSIWKVRIHMAECIHTEWVTRLRPFYHTGARASKVQMIFTNGLFHCIHAWQQCRLISRVWLRFVDYLKVRQLVLQQK